MTGIYFNELVSIQFGSSQYHFMDADVDLYTSTQRFIILRQFVLGKKNEHIACVHSISMRFCHLQTVVVCLKWIWTMLLKKRADYYRFIDVNTSKGLHTRLPLPHSLETEETWRLSNEHTKKKHPSSFFFSAPLSIGYWKYHWTCLQKVTVSELYTCRKESTECLLTFDPHCMFQRW